MAKSVITNTGATRFIGYLPPHGKKMVTSTTVTIDGDLRTLLAASRRSGKIKLASLDADEAAGRIHVVDHPSLEVSS